MIIKLIPNTFEKSGRIEKDVPYKYATVKAYFKKHFKGNSWKEFAPIVSGKRVEWNFKPCKDDEIIFVNDLQNTYSIVSGVLGAAFIVFGAMTSWAGGGYLVAIGISMLAGAIAGAAAEYFAPSTDVGTGFESSPSYSWDGTKNVYGEGNCVPILYGEHEVGGVVIESSVDGGVSGIQDKRYLNVLLAISEGPIHSIDTTKLKINDQPFDNFDSAAQVWTRLGEINQTPIDNFSKVSRYYAMMSAIKITQSSPYVYNTYNNVHSARVTIALPAVYRINDNGKVRGITISMRAEYATQAAPNTWYHAGDFGIEGKSQSQLLYDYVFNFPSKTKYKVRITRLENDYTGSTEYFGDTYISAVSEVENSVVAYVNTALYGIRLQATDKLSGAAPNFTVMAVGRKIADVRDGSVTVEGAKNPANIIYDILTNQRYGLGKDVSADMIDLASLQDFANWCDELVDYREWNTTTGTYDNKVQKRYQIGLILDTRDKAIDYINKICNSCRAIPFWAGNKFSVVIERPSSTYAQMFNMSNIVKDSFEENYIGFDTIPNMVEVQIRDEADNYKRFPVIGIDKSRVDEIPNTTTINLYGICNKARAKREAVFALKKLKGTRKIVTFVAGADGVVCEPGNLFLFQHDIPQYGFGGHLLQVVGNTLYLNESIPLESGKQHTIRIRKADGAFKVYTWTQGSTVVTAQVTIDNATGIAADDLWVCGEVLKEAKPFRAVSITKSSKREIKIVGSEYNETIFNEDENIDVRETNYSHLGLVAKYRIDGSLANPPPGSPDPQGPGVGPSGEIPPLVLDVTAFEELTLVGNIYRSDIVVTWSPVVMSDNSLARIVKYLIIFSTDTGQTWEIAGETTAHGYFRIPNVEVGDTYYIHVKPYTNYDVTNHIEFSEHKLDNAVTVQGDIAAPTAPANLTITGDIFCNKLDWDNPTDPDIDSIEVWAGVQNNRDTAGQLVARVRADNWVHSGLNQSVTYYYWLRASDTAGNFSPWYPASPTAGISCSPTANPAKVLSLLTASVTEGQLLPALLSKINQASTDAATAITEVSGLEGQIDGLVTTFYQAAPPTAQAVGDLWIETDNSNKLFRWSGSAWVEVRDAGIAAAISAAGTAQATADGKIKTYYQTAQPSSGMSVGDLWIDTDDKNKLYRYSGSAWQLARDADIATALTNAAQAITDAATAQATADGKVTTYYQAAAPTGMTATDVGDLWLDTDDGNKLYRYSGSAWVAVQDAKIQQALNDALAAQNTANGKITTFYQAAQPTALASGDLWVDTDDNNKLYRWSGATWQAIDDLRIPTLSSEVTLIKNQWTLKIQEDDYVSGAGLLLYEDWVSTRAYAVDDYVWHSAGANPTITYVGASAAVNGTTSLAIAYPSGFQAKDMLVICISNKYPTNAPSAPAGWTVLANNQKSGGAGSAGADVGTVYSTIFVKEALGNESGTQSVSIPSGNAATGVMLAFRKDFGVWSTACCNGADTTAGTAWSATGNVNPGIQDGDFVVAASAVNSDGPTWSGHALTAAGISSWGTITEVIDAGTTNGDDLRLVVTYREATGGSATGAPVYTMTGSTSGTNFPAGATVMLRLRANPFGNGFVYKCIQANTNIQPPNGTYWEEIPYGAKSEFIILADKFAVVKPDGSGNVRVPFIVGTVGGVSDMVGIAGDLVIDGSLTVNKIAAGQIFVGHTIQSNGYVAGSAGWKINADGSAELNNATVRGTLVVGSGSSGYSNLNDKPAASDIYNSYLWQSPNICPGGNFEGGFLGWGIGYTAAHGLSGYGYDMGGYTLKEIKGTVPWLSQNGRVGSAIWVDYAYMFSEPISVVPGKRYCCVCYLGSHRCPTRVYIQFYNSADGGIGGSALAATGTNNQEGVGGITLDTFKRCYDFGVAPAGTSYARLIVMKGDTVAGQTNSYLFAAKAGLYEVGANQTTPPPDGLSDVTLISGGYIRTEVLTADRITVGTMNAARIAAGTITADRIVTGSLTYSQFANNSATATLITAATGQSAQVGPFLVVGGGDEAFFVLGSAQCILPSYIDLQYYISSWVYMGYRAEIQLNGTGFIQNSWLIKPGGSGYYIYFRTLGYSITTTICQATALRR